MSPTLNDVWYSNPRAREWTAAPSSRSVAAFHQSLNNYAPTPLIEVPSIASELSVGRVFVKDESSRLDLSAFKILGASWAVARALTDGDTPTSLAQVASGINREAPPTLIAATDGNHGRAVAHMAKLLDLECFIVIPRGVSDQAIDNVCGEGAGVEVIDGTYDDAVLRARDITHSITTSIHVQDMSWPGYEDIPQWIIDGYATMCVEVDQQLLDMGSAPVDLVAVPVGVGSFLHSVVSHYRGNAHSRPVVLSIEPTTAACVLASLQHEELTSVDTGVTIMSGMNCGTPSSDSWPVHRAGVDAAIAISDDDTRAALATLHDLDIDAGPCGAATLAGVRSALQVPGSRFDMGLTQNSVVVLLSTEGRAANPFS